MSWKQAFRRWIPRPFKFIQQKLDIREEWITFKTQLRPHRYKIRIFFLVITSPLYFPYLQIGITRIKKASSQYFQQQTTPDKPTFQWIQNFFKHLLDHIFNDQFVKGQALSFVSTIIKDPQFTNDLLQLLVSALKSEPFMKQLKASLGEIIVDQLKQQQVKNSLVGILSQVAADPQVKDGFIKLIQEVFSSQESIDTIVSLLKKGITNDEVKGALGQSVNFAVRQVLSDEETLSQLKIFLFFLMRKFQNDDQIKGMMDILFAKGLGLVKKKKDSELQKILKPKKSDEIA